MTPRVEADTPLMQQYREIKARHPDTILFFRMGDFYEMFEDDAQLAARELGLTLTSRNNGGASEVPLAGVPVKAATEYLRRLIGLGHRVAICEQVEDPKLAKGLVRRAVVETVTPGSVLADDWLERGRNNFLLAVDARSAPAGIAALDLTTGELLLETVASEDLAAVLARYEARELVLPGGTPAPLPLPSAVRTEREAWEFDPELGREELARTFRMASLDGLGVEPGDRPALGAVGALLRYARELKPGGLPHLARPRMLRRGDLLPLDEMTRRNLELVEPLRADPPGHPGAAGATRPGASGGLGGFPSGVCPTFAGRWTVWKQGGGHRCSRKPRPASISSRTWATSSPGRWWSARRPRRPTATRSEPGTITSSTSSRTLATAGSSTSPGSRRASASAPASPRSRSGSTRSSAITSRSRTRTGTACRQITSGARRCPAPSGSSRPS